MYVLVVIILKKSNVRFVEKIKKNSFWEQISIMRKNIFFIRNLKSSLSSGSSYTCFGKVSNKFDERFLRKRGYR